MIQCRLIILVFSIALLLFPVGVIGQSPAPPEPSYRDQWISLDSSSPMLDLRNAPEKPDKPEVSTPEQPTTREDTTSKTDRRKNDQDTKKSAQSDRGGSKDIGSGDRNSTGGSKESTETKTSPEKESTSSNSSDADPDEKNDQVNTDKDSGSDQASGEEKAGGTSETDGAKEELTEKDRLDQGGFRQKETERNQTYTSKQSDRINQSHDEDALEGPPLPGPQETGVDKLVQTKPEESDTLPEADVGIVNTDEPATGPVSATVENHSSVWGKIAYPWYVWTIAGMGILLMGLAYLELRRSRVTVLESTSRRVGDFFENRIKRSRDSDEPLTGRRFSIDKDSNKKVMGSFREAEAEENIWEQPDDRLKELGIDPEYRKVLRLYYSENLSPEQIARQTGRGKGEVGLILDMGGRVREDLRHGKGT